MKFKQLLIVFFLFTILSCSSNSSDSENVEIQANQYGLKVVNKIEDYNKLVNIDKANAIVNLQSIISNLKLDIRYATTNNFTKQIVYDTALAFLRINAANALKSIQEELKAKNLGLLVYDAYRPYSITIKFYEIYKDTNFVAAPWLGSRHNRACAVDVSLIDLATGKEIAMPSAYDDFSDKAKPDYANLPDTVKANRKLLIDIMAKYNFEVHHSEWWHFDYKGWENFYLMDIPLKAKF